MEITYDPIKNETNIINRELSFERVIDFDFATAIIWQDTRKQYTEIRMNALGYIDNRLYFLCFTPTLDGIRIISFRKANKREEHTYAAT